jgi:IS66 C-terminal element
LVIRVGQEKLPALPEEKVLEPFRFGRRSVKLLRMDHLLDHHDDILQAVDYLVTGSLQVTAKHLGLKGTQRRTLGRRHGIEPYTYLRDVLTRLPTMTNRQIKDIVPKAWAAALRNTASRAA